MVSRSLKRAARHNIARAGLRPALWTVEDPGHKADRYEHWQEADVKIGIIGAGAVGAATVGNLIQPGGVNPEIVLIDRDEKKAVGLAEDFSYAAALDSLATVRAGGYDDLGDADLVIVNAGVNEKDGGATDRSDPLGRHRLIPVNAGSTPTSSHAYRRLRRAPRCS